jgi:threonine dehydrogenase-like Zn-dependent dehydrogenase
MRAVCWYGKQDMRVEEVPDPVIINPRDAIVAVSSTAICGSDLHLYNGHNPAMRPGDIMGHEFMGEVVDVGSEVKRIQRGDRVVVPFPIACGQCWHCKKEEWSLCDNTNPNAWMAERVFGHSPAGLFGYSHMLGGYAGGQAEYVRVPFADVGCLKVDGELEDEQVLFLSDVLPTAYMAVEQAEIQAGDVVAVWGCGPVGQLAIRCAQLFDAGRIIAIDRIPARLLMARDQAGAEIIDYGETDVYDALNDMTGGRGPDVVIDAVGLEANGHGAAAIYDKAKQAVGLESDRPTALRQAILACRKGGRVSIPGVYAGFVDKLPMGAAMNKALSFKMGQTHCHRYMQPLLDRIQKNELDASFIVTHRLVLSDAPAAYDLFNEKDGCVKVVLEP